jgi:hypothetical protein
MYSFEVKRSSELFIQKAFMPLQEVILQTRQALQAAVVNNFDLVEAYPPLRHFQLADDLLITELDDHLAEQIMDCCEQRVFGIPKPVRLSPQLYAFVRLNPENDSIWDWVPDQRLEHCVALSRLVHPTSIPLSMHVKISVGADGNLLELIPIETALQGAFIADRGGRDWLTTGDARQLRDLVSHLPLSVPKRVSRALWYFEMAARNYFADIRWTLIATGLEALVHTERGRSTHQFTTRTSRLAEFLKIAKFTRDAALSFYDLRSGLSHGQGLGTLAGPEQELYTMGEDVLRTALLRSILDEAFASTFADTASINLNWAI